MYSRINLGVFLDKKRHGWGGLGEDGNTRVNVFGVCDVLRDIPQSLPEKHDRHHVHLCSRHKVPQEHKVRVREHFPPDVPDLLQVVCGQDQGTRHFNLKLGEIGLVDPWIVPGIQDHNPGYGV